MPVPVIALKKTIEALQSEERFFTKEDINRLLDLKDGSDYTLEDVMNSVGNKIKKIALFTKYLDVNDEPIRSKFLMNLYIFRDSYIKLVADIAENILSESKETLVLSVLHYRLQFQLLVYLGMDDYLVEYSSISELKAIIELNPDKFVITRKSEFEPISKYKVGLKEKESTFLNDELFILNLLRVFRRDEDLPISKILLKLNLASFESGHTKPFTLNTLEQVFSRTKSPFFVRADKLIVPSLFDRITNAKKELSTVDDFDANRRLSGLLLLFFTGDKFIFNEILDYVNLRNLIYMKPVKILESESEKLLSDDGSELFRILIAKIPEQDINAWMRENIAVSFVIEDYNYLKLNFDKLMAEYSPVFNLDKNPGNLFRGIIEEKIREYESGKQQ